MFKRYLLFSIVYLLVPYVQAYEPCWELLREEEKKANMPLYAPHWNLRGSVYVIVIDSVAIGALTVQQRENIKNKYARSHVDYASLNEHRKDELFALISTWLPDSNIFNITFAKEYEDGNFIIHLNSPDSNILEHLEKISFITIAKVKMNSMQSGFGDVDMGPMEVKRFWLDDSEVKAWDKNKALNSINNLFVLGHERVAVSLLFNDEVGESNYREKPYARIIESFTKKNRDDFLGMMYDKSRELAWLNLYVTYEQTATLYGDPIVINIIPQEFSYAIVSKPTKKDGFEHAMRGFDNEEKYVSVTLIMKGDANFELMSDHRHTYQDILQNVTNTYHNSVTLNIKAHQARYQDCFTKNQLVHLNDNEVVINIIPNE